MAREQLEDKKNKEKEILTREQVKERVYKKKVKRALKIARLRPLKNFLFWFAGVLSSIAIIAGSIFVGVKVVPISTYVGKENANKYVSEELSNKSFLDAILEIKNYGISDLPIIESTLRDLIDDGDLGEYLTVDYEKLNAIMFADDDVIPSITECLKIIATLDGLGATDSLGDLGELSCFKDFEKIDTDVDDYPKFTTDENGVKKLDTETCEPKLYYYVVETKDDTSAKPLSKETVEESEEPEEPEDPNVYGRVFDDDGYFTSEELASLSVIEYYYPAITKIPLMDALDLIDESFGRLTVMDMINTLGGGSDEESEEDNLIEKIFGDKKVKDLDSFSASDIKLSSVIDLPTIDNDYENKKIYDIILQTTTDENVTCYEDLTVDSLNGMGNFDNVKLSTVLDLPTEENEYKNQKVYDMLCDATGKASDEVTVADLSDFSTDSVKLSTVLDLPTEENEYKNQKIYDMLCDATGKTSESLSVQDLSNFSTDNVKLSTVLDLPTEENEYKNQKIYNILCDATGKAQDELSVADMSDFKTDNIKLSTVIEDTDSKIFSILSGAVTDDLGNPKDKNDLTVSDLDDKNFNTNNILLKDVLSLSEDSKLYKILCGASGKEYDEIRVGTLGGGESEFSINRVKLSDILDSTDNAILKVLLTKGTTVGSLSTDIAKLSLYEVYGESCFKAYDTPGAQFIGNDTWFAKEEVDTDGDGVVDHLAFVHEENDYFIANPTVVKYGLCKNDGIWLLLCFDGLDFEDADTNADGILDKDTDGRPEKYVVSDRTLGDLETDATALSNSFKGATVRQLMDAGIVPEGNYNQRLYTLTLVQTVQELSDAFDDIDNAING